MRTDIKLVLELVSGTQSDLTKMQAKLNQWITTGLLVKFETQAMGDMMLFKIILKKGAE